jgi:hypothetical protein
MLIGRFNERIKNAKVAALAPATFAYEKSYEKLKKNKDHIDQMLANEKLSPFGAPFYIRAFSIFSKLGLEKYVLQTLR